MVNYQPDIYGNLADPESNAEGMILRDGRILNALIFWLFRKPDHPYAVFYYISYVLSLVVMIIALCIYTRLLSEQLCGKILADNAISRVLISLLSCMTIANMFSAEFFLYPDMMLAYVLAILLCVISVSKFIRFIQLKKIKYLIIITCCLTMCVSMAETTASLFLILTVPFILYYSESFIDFVKYQFASGTVYGVSMIYKFIFTMFVVSSDRAGFDKPGLAETSAKYAPEGVLPQMYVFDRITFGMWFYLAILFVGAVYLVWTAIRKRQSFEIVKGLYIVGLSLLFGLLPYWFRLTNDYKPRIYYPIGALIGVLILYGMLIILIDIKNDVVRNAVFGFLIILGTVQWLSFIQMFVDQYVTNYEDKYISEMIGERIKGYELESGCDVQYVVFYSDAIRTKYARNEGWCITQRAYDANWSKLPTLNYYLDMDYANGEVSEEFVNYFRERNWDTFSYQQLIFEGDTLHICTY